MGNRRTKLDRKWTIFIQVNFTIINLKFKQNSFIMKFKLRTLFKINPAIMQFYSFYKDEWNRVSYYDYNGAFVEQNSNTWLLLFRYLSLKIIIRKNNIFFINFEEMFFTQVNKYLCYQNCILA